MSIHDKVDGGTSEKMRQDGRELRSRCESDRIKDNNQGISREKS